MKNLARKLRDKFSSGTVAFRTLDSDGSGSISRKELAGALQRMDVQLREEETWLLMDMLDSDKSGVITEPEFLDFWDKLILKSLSKKLREKFSSGNAAFQLMDRDGSGALSKSEIVAALLRVSVHLDPQVLSLLGLLAQKYKY